MFSVVRKKINFLVKKCILAPLFAFLIYALQWFCWFSAFFASLKVSISCWAQSTVFRLTVGALLPPSSPVTAALCPAAHTASLHGTLGTRLGEAAQRGVVVSIIVHGRAGDRGAEPPHGGVSRQQSGGSCRAHPNHGSAQDVADAVGRPCLQLAVQTRVKFVERVGHWVLAHRCLELRGELVQAVVEQERPLDVWIHGKFITQPPVVSNTFS